MAAKEKKEEHPLHKRVGEYIRRYIEESGKSDEYKVISDRACAASDCSTNKEALQYIPLFCSEIRANKNEYCNVDMMIVKKDPEEHISVLIEIEESDIYISPTKICGKFLASALCSHYIHKTNEKESLPLVSPIWFLQIVDTSRLSEKSNKKKQFENLEKSIQAILPVRGSAIQGYRLIYVNKTHDDAEKEVGQFLKEILD